MLTLKTRGKAPSFVLGNVYWTFNLLAVFCLFETSPMFYPLEGGFGSSSQGVQLFLLMFYPPKGLCKADTEGGPIVFTYVLFWVRKRILDFFLQTVSGLF